MPDRIHDCTACVNLQTHPSPSQPFHFWRCAANGLCVGPTVMNCGHFRQRKGGETPPRADVSAFVWRDQGAVTLSDEAMGARD